MKYMPANATALHAGRSPPCALPCCCRQQLSIQQWQATARMYVVTDKGGGIALMIAALLLLGTWPAIFNLLVRPR
jgi:hypothetical protein